MYSRITYSKYYRGRSHAHRAKVVAVERVHLFDAQIPVEEDGKFARANVSIHI